MITACGLGYSASPIPTPTRLLTVTPSITPIQVQPSATSSPPSTSTPKISCPSYGKGPNVYLDEVPAFAIRQGPGCEYEKAYTMLVKENPIAFFDVLDKQGDWLLIDLCNNQQGWAFAPAIDDMNIHLYPYYLPTSPVSQELTPTTIVSMAEHESMEQAKDTLTSFFDYLYHKKYDEASKIFSGGYGVILRLDANLDAQDYPSLLKIACEDDVFQCALRVSQVVKEEQISPMEYHFTVELIKEDGSLYQRPDNKNVMTSQFLFRVVKDCDGKYFVVDWPFYGF